MLFIFVKCVFSFYREVLKWLTFGPEPHKLFSNSGCKRIIPKVGSVMEQILFDM